MRGASALGGFVSLDDEESFGIEYWPLELYKLSLAPPPGEFQGVVVLVTGGAGGIGSAVAQAFAAGGACVVVTDIDLDGAAPGRCRARRHRGRRRGRRHRRGLRDRRLPRGRARLRRRRHRDLECRHRLERADHRDLGRALGSQPRHPRPRVLPGREGGRAPPDRAGNGRQHHLRRLEERARAGQGRGRVLGGQGGRAASCALSRRGARAARRAGEHRQPGRRPRGLADLGLLVARGARARLRDRGRRARGASTASGRR